MRQNFWEFLGRGFGKILGGKFRQIWLNSGQIWASLGKSDQYLEKFD